MYISVCGEMGKINFRILSLFFNYTINSSERFILIVFNF